MINKPIVGMVICFVLLSASGFSDNQDRIPEEYREEEFPQLLKDLRRAEIIFIGSFPISLFLSFETYDIYRFFANNREPEYSPWPFQRHGGVPYDPDETIGVLISALSISFILALADFTLGKIREAKNKNRTDQDS